uniref:Uncharacterized protein n=1 Tax=Vespula pensylvanica TaxID=30213 RepID=A0A834K465_VESPE|nr:hypothetical protein H0235_016498 [Vespula pensylvanica]
MVGVLVGEENESSRRRQTEGSTGLRVVDGSTLAKASTPFPCEGADRKGEKGNSLQHDAPTIMMIPAGRGKSNAGYIIRIASLAPGQNP